MRAVHEPAEGQAVIDGAPVMLGPVLNADAIKDWKTKDCTARRILLSTIEEKLQNTLVGCKTAFQIWTRLSSQHNKCAANNRYVIQRKFLNYDYQQGNLLSLFIQQTIFFLICAPLFVQAMTPCPTSRPLRTLSNNSKTWVKPQLFCKSAPKLSTLFHLTCVDSLQHGRLFQNKNRRLHC